jgi:hypothetical protein
MVWCGIHESPGFEAFAEILERNVSPTAGSIMRAPFGLSDANELSRLSWPWRNTSAAAGYHSDRRSSAHGNGLG